MLNQNSTFRAGLTVCFTLLAASFQSAQAFQQISFSVDWHGNSVGIPSSNYAFPITEGDILLPAAGVPMLGPLATPDMVINAGFAPGPGLGLWGHLPCAGHPGGTPCIVEVDGMSYGNDPLTGPGFPLVTRFAFSVDRYATGLFSAAWPDVVSEAAFGDAPSDIFIDLGLGVGPLAPFAATTPGNVAVVDGNGMISGSGAQYGGIGLNEPFTTANPGDNVDALAMMGPPSGFPISGVYFTLDDIFVDPLTGIFNSGSAQAHGFVGADILFSAAPGGPPVLYAPAAALGLNLTGSSDDVDGLIVRENGTPGYQPSLTPNDWVGGGTDMLLFSVRRGSHIIGQPDSIFGLPIVEGDILTTPLFGSPIPFPGIYIAAENLGLLTSRAVVGALSDDLDGMTILSGPINDCNGNGVEDAIDISSGNSWDTNGNGIPDDCELLTRAFCECSIPSPAPCLNFYPTGGCTNSTGVGAILGATGTTSVTNDNLVLSATQVPLNRVGILLKSVNITGGVPFRDGILCLGPQIFRFNPTTSGGSGTLTWGPGLVAYCFGNFAAPGWILPGSTWNFQAWYRDPIGPCGQLSNLSNAISAFFTP